MTRRQRYRCRFCGAILQAWLRVAGKPQVDLVRTWAGLGLALQQAIIPMAEAELSTSAGESPVV
jgi:hypothetical protein